MSHVTAYRNGTLYGHYSTGCDAGGCAGSERVLAHMTRAALENLAEVGTVNPLSDVAEVQEGRHDRTSLLAACFDGAEEDRAQGWRDYVDAVIAASGDDTAERYGADDALATKLRELSDAAK